MWDILYNIFEIILVACVTTFIVSLVLLLLGGGVGLIIIGALCMVHGEFVHGGSMIVCGLFLLALLCGIIDHIL